jgi:predicted MPP superfamily phosphohydrolase
MKYVYLALNITVYLLAHLLMFFIWRYFFFFDSIYLYITASAILFTSVVLTIIAPLFIHWRDNVLSRALYLVMSLWAGFILNSVLLAGLYFLIIFIWPNFINLIGVYLNIYILILPLLMLLPEAWAARNTKVSLADVGIKNLPKNWAGKRIIHVSDVHLGPIWRQAFFDRLVSKINSLEADAIFITGDLFDGMEADFSWFHQRKMSAPLGVYYSFGNHDMILGKDRVKALLSHSAIRVLDDELILEEGLQIIGLSCYYEGKMDVKSKLVDEIGFNASRPSILLYHEPKDVKDIKGLGINLQLSGHVHAGQMFPFNLLAKLLYGGFVSGIYKIENFNLSLTAGAGTWGPPLRLGSRSEIRLITLLAKN